jgi:hypothetical protein
MALLLDVPWGFSWVFLGFFLGFSWGFLGIFFGTFSGLEPNYRLKQAAMHRRALSAASSNFEG